MWVFLSKIRIKNIYYHFKSNNTKNSKICTTKAKFLLKYGREKTIVAPMKPSIRQKLRAIADFFFPRICIGCGEVNAKGRFNFICPQCSTDIFYCRGGRCLICGELLGASDMPNMRGCHKCNDMRIAYKEALCPVVFGGKVKDLIHALKYAKALHVAGDLAKIALLHPETKAFLRDAYIVPVPLHWRRRFSRGYNQAEEVAKALIKTAPELNAKITHPLKRARPTSTQTRLSREERAENIKGAFEPTREAAELDKSKRIVIFDDVMTTAATINECARILKRAGFKDIYAFAIAKKI